MQFIGDLTPDCENALFRYNSAAQGFHTEACRACATSVTSPCVSPWRAATATFSHNVWYAPGALAGEVLATDRPVLDPGYLDLPGGNLRLGPRSPAINAGDPSDYPPRDIEGERRPEGRAPDAGADEAR